MLILNNQKLPKRGNLAPPHKSLGASYRDSRNLFYSDGGGVATHSHANFPHEKTELKQLQYALGKMDFRKSYIDFVEKNLHLFETPFYDAREKERFGKFPP